MVQLANRIVAATLMETQAQHEEAVPFLVIIGRVANLLPRQLGIPDICRELTRIIIEETTFDNCSLLLWDAQSGSLDLAAAEGLEGLLEGGTAACYNRNLRFGAHEGLAGQAFASKQPVFIEDASQRPLPPKEGALIRPASLACLPLLDEGVLNLSSYRPQCFTSQARRSWEIIGRIIGHLLHGVCLETRNGKAGPPRLGTSPPPVLPAGAGNGEAGSVSLLTEDALEYMPQGICLLDIEGKVTWVNHSIERSYGGNASELTGRSPAVMFHDPGTFQGLFERVAVSQMEELPDVPLVNAEGEVYTADLSLVTMKDHHGEAKGFLLVINDISKKKAFADKMLQAEKLAALGTMAGGVAHDFNNLLMAILGNLQLLLPDVQEEETLRRLKNIEKAVHDGANTVRRLQKFTERDLQHQLAPATADINDAIRDVVEMTRPRWKNAMEKHGHIIQFELDLAPQCFSRIHVSDFREVLTNLVFNALEAMPQGGTITIRTRLSKESVVIDLTDTGIGMSKEVASKIFDPFYTTKGIANSGLGLSVSWSLIARSGGEIQVKSKPGKGTSFTIRLPKATPSPRLASKGGSAKPPANHRLLVVDDDEDVLWIIQDMLRFKGYRVVALADAEKALAILESETFDLVLTDLGMPHISGWDIARKAKDKNPKLPVVLLTGWGTQYEEEDVATEGVDAVLSKPLSWEKLTDSIGRLL